MPNGHPHSPLRQVLLGCLTLLVLLVLVVFAGVLFWTYWPWRAGNGLNPNAQPRAVTARGNLSQAETANIQVYDEASPCVVQVTNISESESTFGLNVQEVPKGVGSGFVWDQDGHIVTNNHVVKGGNAAKVMLSDHTTYDARQIWTYPDQDIAVIWIDAPRSELHPIPVGTSHDLKVGQIVYALGDPFALDLTMTTGIISALNREIRTSSERAIRGAIQTSAAINPGNSGGPLLDSAGRLIGMNTAILSPSGTFAGIGFAIPVDEINRTVPQLIAHGKVVRPRLGVQLAPDQTAQQLGVDKGALIIKVLPNTPAAEAGLQGTHKDNHGRMQLGDIILAIDGHDVNSVSDVYDQMDSHHPGDQVTLTIERDSEQKDVKLTLEKLPEK